MEPEETFECYAHNTDVTKSISFQVTDASSRARQAVREWRATLIANGQDPASISIFMVEKKYTWQDPHAL